jgi:hypothetical protein
MKKIAIAIALVILGAFAFSQDNGLRFERLLDEHKDARYNHAAVFEVWHDKVSGQEIICIGSRDSNNTGGLDGRAYPLSCFLSGRNWK